MVPQRTTHLHRVQGTWTREVCLREREREIVCVRERWFVCTLSFPDSLCQWCDHVHITEWGKSLVWTWDIIMQCKFKPSFSYFRFGWSVCRITPSSVSISLTWPEGNMFSKEEVHKLSSTHTHYTTEPADFKDTIILLYTDYGHLYSASKRLWIGQYRQRIAHLVMMVLCYVMLYGQGISHWVMVACLICCIARDYYPYGASALFYLLVQNTIVKFRSVARFGKTLSWNHARHNVLRVKFTQIVDDNYLSWPMALWLQSVRSQPKRCQCSSLGRREGCAPQMMTGQSTAPCETSPCIEKAIHFLQQKEHYSKMEH